MSTRAKRMRKALESLGWDCDDSYESRKCCNCGAHVSDMRHKFCHSCGKRLTAASKARSTVSQLEASLAYALGETKKVPVNP
jgi:predicted amidophosphoribosyltransferase